ncbi:putative Transcription initiation factor TFIID subunit 5 [Blattamonas nauphoetae]|uniref:Transcription initiation factor TFIID subunit 5 n=1 Tax=Blattamonas nauphoetae TaxID=2049346 RepID=A0ABQ9YLD5_9EUKA|nr:putative Transcription initiation factor TFIID subunit 5 [Blattamonas nauphoetae]
MIDREPTDTMESDTVSQELTVATKDEILRQFHSLFGWVVSLSNPFRDELLHLVSAIIIRASLTFHSRQWSDSSALLIKEYINIIPRLYFPLLDSLHRLYTNQIIFRFLDVNIQNAINLCQTGVIGVKLTSQSKDLVLNHLKLEKFSALDIFIRVSIGLIDDDTSKTSKTIQKKRLQSILPPIPPPENLCEYLKKNLQSSSTIQLLSQTLKSHTADTRDLPSIMMFSFFNTQNLMSDISFSPTSEFLATGMSDSSICLWSLIGVSQLTVQNPTLPPDVLSSTESAIVSTTLHLHSDAVHRSLFSPDNRSLISAGRDGRVCIVSLATQHLSSIIPTFSPILDIAVSTTLIATSSYDRCIRLWPYIPGDQTDPQTTYSIPTPLRIIPVHTSDIEILQFNSDFTLLAGGLSDGNIVVCHVDSGTIIQTLRMDEPEPITAIAWSDMIDQDVSRPILIVANFIGDISLFDVQSGRQLLSFPLVHHSSPIWSIVVDPETVFFATAGKSSTIAIWDLRSIFSASSVPLEQQADSYQSNQFLTKVFPANDLDIRTLRFIRPDLIVSAGIFQNTPPDPE